jgi:hypothetical protein
MTQKLRDKERTATKTKNVYELEGPSHTHHQLPSLGWNNLLHIRRSSPSLERDQDGIARHFIEKPVKKGKDPFVLSQKNDFFRLQLSQK